MIYYFDLIFIEKQITPRMFYVNLIFRVKNGININKVIQYFKIYFNDGFAVLETLVFFWYDSY